METLRRGAWRPAVRPAGGERNISGDSRQIVAGDVPTEYVPPAEIDVSRHFKGISKGSESFEPAGSNDSDPFEMPTSSSYFAGFAQCGAVAHFDVSNIAGSTGTSTFQSEYSSVCCFTPFWYISIFVASQAPFPTRS